ncbi:MAG: hypothetical protein HQL06_15460 [Nitrospirae bacterium]|nr:hypothetical protein [Nitrospirota bacterium]
MAILRSITYKAGIVLMLFILISEIMPPDCVAAADDAIAKDLITAIEKDIKSVFKGREQKRKERCQPITYIDSLWQSIYLDYTGEFVYDIQETDEPDATFKAVVMLDYYWYFEIKAEGPSDAIYYGTQEECIAKLPKYYVKKTMKLKEKYVTFIGTTNGS